MTSSRTIEGVWHPEIRDLQEYIRLSLRTGLLTAAGAAMFLVSLAMAVLASDPFFTAAFSALSALSLVLALWGLLVRWVLPGSVWKHQPSVRRTTTYRLSADGVSARQDVADGTYRWAAFVGAVESDTVFLLHTATGMQKLALVLPKRAFAVADVVAIRELITANVISFRKV